MKPLNFLFIVLLVTARVETPSAGAPLRSSEHRAPHSTRLIVKLKPQLAASKQADKLLADQGLVIRKRFRHSPETLVLVRPTA